MSTHPASSHGPVSPLLDDDEARVARARLQLTQLAADLVRDPLSRTVHQALRAFLETDSEPALRSWEAMLARSPEELRERIRTVITSQAERRAS